jgi:hypothetical protein
MSVAVTQPPKNGSPFDKVGSLLQAASMAKGMMGGKDGQAPKVETGQTAMQRRLEVMRQQQAAGEQGPY